MALVVEAAGAPPRMEPLAMASVVVEISEVVVLMDSRVEGGWV